MSTIFVRHAAPEPPYDDYDNLTLHELDLLATEKVQPHINHKIAKHKIQKHIESNFLKKDSIDIIYYSPSLRARETAKLLASELSVNKSSELEYLKEIAFSPKKLISEKTFKSTGMNGLRDDVYRAIEQGKADESHRELATRIDKVQELLAVNSDKNVLIVTHGFFLRLLQITLLGKKSVFTAHDQKRAKNYDYLEGLVYK